MVHTFWALSNCTASDEVILDKFLVVEGFYGEGGKTGFDGIVQNCFLVLELMNTKKVFVESMFVLCNFLTLCCDG